MGKPHRLPGWRYAGRVRVFITCATYQRHTALTEQGTGTSSTSKRKLWQGNYWDHILRDPDEALKVAMYIVSDPIRSGLVSELMEYPWWGSECWSRETLAAAATTAPKPTWWSEC